MNLRIGHNVRQDERGMAIIVVLAVLILLAALLAANTNTLRALKRELQLVNERQLQKYGDTVVTNAVPHAPQRNRKPGEDAAQR